MADEIAPSVYQGAAAELSQANKQAAPTQQKPYNS